MMDDPKRTEVLYQLHEGVLGRLQAMNNPQFVEAKLCGGTALSRCWLNHRISYDLDFFLPQGFKAGEMAATIKKAGIVYETKDIVDDPRKANQLHGYVVHVGQSLKVSFVEDAYFNLYPAVEAKFGNLMVKTEDVPGLYHRKLRTVAGSGATGEEVEGGRQKARDLFDLYVLSVEFMPIRQFMASLPYTFPSDAFDNGLASMPWFDLVDELGEIVCDERWNAAKDVSFLQEALYSQIGAKAIIDEFAQELEPDSQATKRSAKATGKKK
jgi:hypothetical protein